MVESTIKIITDIYNLLESDNEKEGLISFILIFVPLLAIILPKIAKVFVEGISEIPIEKITMTNYQKFNQIYNIAVFSFIYFMIIFILMLGNDYKEKLYAAILLSVGTTLIVFLIVFVPSKFISLKYNYYIKEQNDDYKFLYKRDNYYLFRKVVDNPKEEDLIFKEKINDIKIRYEIKELNRIQNILVKSNYDKIFYRIIVTLSILSIIITFLFPILFLSIASIILLFIFIMIKHFNKILTKNHKKFMQN